MRKVIQSLYFLRKKGPDVPEFDEKTPGIYKAFDIEENVCRNKHEPPEKGKKIAVPGLLSVPQ